MGPAGEYALWRRRRSRVCNKQVAERAHNLSVSDEMIRSLENAEKAVAGMDADSDDARLVKLYRELLDKEIKVPSGWVSEFAQTTANANNVWEEAKAKNDFALFQPYLEKIVEMRRQYADFFKPYEHIYDPLCTILTGA